MELIDKPVFLFLFFYPDMWYTQWW